MRTGVLTLLVGVGFSVCAPARAEPCADLEACRTACVSGDAAGCAERRRLRMDFVIDIRAGGLWQWSEADLAADCQRDRGDNCTRVGQLLEARGDLAGAEWRYRQTCRGGKGRGCSHLVRLHAMTGDPRAAILALNASCDDWNSGNCYLLGRAVLDGKAARVELPRDIRAPESALRRACGAIAAACADLARLYELGEAGVKADPTVAADLFALACERGDADSCARSAEILAAGVWTPRDETAAAATRARACSLGYHGIYPDPDPCKR